MPHLLDDAILRAITTEHDTLALTAGSVRKYLRDVAPFAAADVDQPGSLDRLFTLLQPGEETWLYARTDPPPHPGLRNQASLRCLQMAFPGTATLPAVTAVPRPLSCADADAMVALTEIAFPGFFRHRTCAMGRYFGFWDGGQLVAMGGSG